MKIDVTRYTMFAKGCGCYINAAEVLKILLVLVSLLTILLKEN